MPAALLFKLGSTYRSIPTPARFLSFFHPKVITSQDIVRSPYKDVEIANCTLPEHVWSNMEKWSDKTAIICGETNRSYTYHQLYILSRMFAANLRKKLHIADGDVIQVTLHNSPEYAVIVLGILQANAVLTTVNPISTAYEIRHNLLLSNPKLVIGSPATIPSIKKGLSMIYKKIPIINVDLNNGNTFKETISYQEFLQDTDISVLLRLKRNIDDVSVLSFSSGTTGLPKGVELTARSLVTNYIQQDIEEIKQYNDTTASYQESVLAVLPFTHIYGLSLILLHKLSVGAKIVTLSKFHPRTFLDSLKEHKVSLLYIAPPIVLLLSSFVNKNNLDSVKKIVNGAASVPKLDVEKMMEKTNPVTQFIQVYGSTESSLVTSTVPGTTDYVSSGYALPNTDLKVVDQEFNTLGPDQVGELLIRGPQTMKGYTHNQEATEATFTEDGWYKSGDLAKINNNGTIQIVDRIKELIKVKGYQVSPVELENVLKEHPSVLDAGVIGVSDSWYGEVPKAFVVLKEGLNVKKEDLLDFVKIRVAEYKTVKQVVFLKTLPKSPSGKLLRRVLKEL